ncbi:hypothetical protein EHP00_529 [Ecytonucleospora hepatopenaei]|uniref:Uncharacterized protein n=1 Tax=Ecytonucleospora hepatopenaei TaxID=646526 RepID=A0A1W0E449_9MICR|nr:hypothetical protein EHP00_529 [Ecytonucleospora hepatopenaei]
MSKKFETFNLLLQQIQGEDSEYEDSDIVDDIKMEYDANAEVEELSEEVGAPVTYLNNVDIKKEKTADIKYEKGAVINIENGEIVVEKEGKKDANKEDLYYSAEELKKVKVTQQKDNSKILLGKKCKRLSRKKCKNFDE